MLNNSQLLVLKTDIASSEFSSLPQNTDNAFAIAAAYNLSANPDFYIWRISVPVEEIMRNGFDWTRVDNLSVGKSRIWEWMTQFGSINPSRANIRAGIDACWVGTAPDLAVRAAVYTHCYQLAKRWEKLFSTGTGTTALPATLDSAFSSVGGNINYQDVESAWNISV